MSERIGRPLLFLDVDGTTIPFRRSRKTPPDGTDPYLSQVRPRTGARLAALPCALVWASTWEDEANADLAPLLGLPKLPVVRWPEPSDAEVLEDRWFGLHWKTRFLLRWAAGRPFVWLDDELTEADVEWVAARRPRRALLHRVDASQGLTEDDLRLTDAWLKTF